MGLFDTISDFVISKVKDGAFTQLAKENQKNGNRNENNYKESLKDTQAGVVLTWIENKPIIGDLLKSLGKSRQEVYKILFSSDGDKVILKCILLIHEFDRLIE